MLRQIRTSVLLLLSFSLLTGLLYPLAVTAVGQLFFPREANGSMFEKGNLRVGSALIGQPFHSSQYFWSRPSATSPVPYNAAASSGSNYGPLNPALHDAVTARIKELREADPGNTARIPIDLVTASSSGLDPHISVAAALYQIPRVARTRNSSFERVRALVDRYTEPRTAGFLGEPRVNVLQLNLALDETFGTKGAR